MHGGHRTEVVLGSRATTNWAEERHQRGLRWRGSASHLYRSIFMSSVSRSRSMGVSNSKYLFKGHGFSKGGISRLDWRDGAELLRS